MATVKPIVRVNKDGSKDSWKNLREDLAEKNIDGIRRIFITADGNTSAKFSLSQSNDGNDWITVYNDKLVKGEFTVTEDRGKVKPIVRVNKDGSKDSWKNLREVLAEKNIDGIRRIFITADGNTSAKIHLSQSNDGDDWITVYDDKLVKGEFTFTVPEPDLKIDWHCNWTEPRTLKVTKEDKVDPLDTRCRLLKVGKPLPTATIGSNEGVLEGGSPRFYIMGKYQNVEMEAEVLPVSRVSQIYLSARSNHQIRDPPGFGGYPFYIDIGDKMIFFKKEETHEQGYSERLAEVSIPFKAGEWFKARVRITNIEDGQVKMQAWFNDTTATSYIDKGQIECSNDDHPKRKAPPFTGIGEACFLRVNSDGKKDEEVSVKVKYRNVVIRKI